MIAVVSAPVILAACASTVIPSGGTVRQPTLVAADGTALPLAVRPAKNGAPAAVTLGLHGYGDDRDAPKDLATLRGSRR